MSASIVHQRAALFAKASQSASYSQFRPTYPPELYQRLFAFADAQSGGLADCRELCVDIATGTGQTLGPLAARYQRIIAQDGSPTQINQAKEAGQFQNVEFQQADAHSTGLPNACADLVTVGQALHWLELPAFYKEVRRILKPSGTFAAWSYDLGNILDQQGQSVPAADHVMFELYEGTLGKYWDPRRAHVEDLYARLLPSSSEFGVVEKQVLTMDQDYTVDQLMGLLDSWSSYTTYRKQHPDRENPLVRFKPDFLATMGPAAQDPEFKFRMRRNVPLVLAAKPVPV